jgi:hypothetical protein
LITDELHWLRYTNEIKKKIMLRIQYTWKIYKIQLNNKIIEIMRALKFEVSQFGNDTMLEYRNKKQKT